MQIFNIICWIGIALCIFYIIRNYYVAYVMFPAGKILVNSWNKAVPPHLKVRNGLRNYYAVVFNPFIWHFIDVIKDKKERGYVKTAWREWKKAEKNSRKIK